MIFRSASHAIHISWSKCCLCVWMLNTLAQVVTDAPRDLHAQTY